jgi:hypothetical protein
VTRIETVYAIFERFEEQLAHCYFLLHERFIRNPRLAKFWMETAMQELEHSAMLRFCRERNSMAEASLETKTLRTVEELVETVKAVAVDPDVSVDEALYASLVIESSELDNVYNKLTAPLASDHELLYQTIQKNLRAHHEAFAKAAAEFSTKPELAAAFRSLCPCLSSRIENPD